MQRYISATDLNNLNNYQYYLGTKEAPITGGFNVTADYKGIRLSITELLQLVPKHLSVLFLLLLTKILIMELIKKQRKCLKTICMLII